MSYLADSIENALPQLDAFTTRIAEWTDDYLKRNATDPGKMNGVALVPAAEREA